MRKTIYVSVDWSVSKDRDSQALTSGVDTPTEGVRLYVVYLYKLGGT